MRQLVSIIIPTYNRSNFLGETLESILRQTYKNLECIVVDDGSTDYTEELMSFYADIDDRVTFYKRPLEKRKGANSCRNYGFSKSKGVFINWFDSDDVMAECYLERQIESMNLNDCDLSICDFSIFKTVPSEYHFRVKNKSDMKNLLKDIITEKVNLGLHGAVWKREIVSNITFNEGLQRAQDLDFFFRVTKSKHLKVSFTEKNLIFLRRHRKSLTGNYFSFDYDGIISELEVRRNILFYAFNSKYENWIISKTLEFYFRGFKMLFLSHSWRRVKEELHYLKSLPFSKRGYFLWEIKLYGFHILQRIKFKKKGFQEHLRKFEFLLLPTR